MVVDRKKVTFWHYIFLSARTGITIINGVLIVPLYLHYIDISLYGAWLATGNILSWITVVDPGVSDVLLQRIASLHGNGDQNETGLSIGSGILISLAVFIVMLCGGYILSFYILDMANYKGLEADLLTKSFRIAMIGGAMSLLANTSNNIMLAFQKTKEAGIASSIFSLIAIAINVILLMNGFGLLALAYTLLVAGFLKLLYTGICSAMLISRNSIILKFDFRYTKQFSSIFLYTFVSRIFEVFSGNIDLLIVSRFIGPQYVAMLELSRRPIKIILGQVNNITISMLPAFSHLVGTNDIKKINEIVQKILLIVIWLTGLLVGCFVLMNQSLITIWTGPNTYFGVLNNNIICIAFFVQSISYACSNFTYSMGKMRNNSIVSVSKNLIYITSLYFLSSRFGITGLLVSFLISILFVEVPFYAKSLIKLVRLTDYQVKNLTKEFVFVLSLILILCMVATVIPVLSLGRIVVVTVVFTMVYGVLLLFFSKHFWSYCQDFLATIQRKFIQLSFYQK